MRRGINRYGVAAAVLLFTVAFALFGGIYFKWYKAPYPSFGKTMAWAIGDPEAAYNFDTVDSGKIYRSALPDSHFLAYVQRRYGIKYLVGLMGPQEIDDSARHLGMKVTVFDWRIRPPNLEDLKIILKLLQEHTGVLVHCESGRDRTGYVIALHRISQQHWSVERAVKEMETYGHSRSRYLTDTTALRGWSDELNRQSSM